MDAIYIGLWVTGGLLVMVVLGMRVAFAAALAGLVGLIVVFWSRKGFAPDELDPHFHPDRVSGPLRRPHPRAVRSGQALDRLGAGRACGFHRFRHCGLCGGLGRVGGDRGGLCQDRDPRDVEDRL